MRHLGEIAWTEGSGVVLADSSAAARWPVSVFDGGYPGFLDIPGFFDGCHGREWQSEDTRFLIWFALDDNPVDVWRIDDRTVLLQQCFLDDYSDPERAVSLLRSLAELEAHGEDLIGNVTVNVSDVVAFPAAIEWAEIAEQVLSGGDGVELTTPLGGRDGGVLFHLPVGSYSCFTSSLEWNGCEVDRLTLRPD